MISDCRMQRSVGRLPEGLRFFFWFVDFTRSHLVMKTDGLWFFTTGTPAADSTDQHRFSKPFRTTNTENLITKPRLNKV